MPRVLIIDEQEEVHEDFKKHLDLKTKMDFESTDPIRQEDINIKYFNQRLPKFVIDSVYNVNSALDSINKSLELNQKYCFVIISLSLLTSKSRFIAGRQILKTDPDIQLIIYTSQTNKEWKDLSTGLGYRHNVTVLSKPYEPYTLQSMAITLSENWRIRMVNNKQIKDLTRAHDLMAIEKMKADQANTSKSEFLANMSHEIRTPLNILMGINEVLQNTNLNEEQENYLKISTRSGEQLLKLLNNLLDLSKIQSGKEVQIPSEFSSKKFFKNLFQTYQFKSDISNVTFVADVSPDIPDMLKADSNKLKIIFTNLIDNALKFATNKKVSVSVSKNSEIINGQIWIKAIVKDSGIGIPKEFLKKIFSSFVQVDSSSIKRFPGTGLGLSITSKYVELLGGTISLKSEVGVGSEFTFTLPLEICENKKEKSNIKEVIKVKKLSKPLKILLAEDNEENVQLMQIFLEKENCTIDVAENGKEAIDLYFENKYDVIFMDMQMPVMDGFQATKIIRQNEVDNNLQKIPLIALTAYSRSNELNACITAGCDDVFRKPVKRSKIILYLQGIIDKFS